MFGQGSPTKVFVATRPIDFRKGIDGLALAVQEMFGLDPFCGAVFVFRSKRADRIKLLFWDQTGMVLAIARPDWELTLLDSLQKRCRFLEEAARELGLQNVDVRWGRAEDLAREPGLRDGFDLVTARAVAEMATLVELCLPFVRPGAGALVAAKGPGPGDEVARAAAAIEALGGAAPKVVPVDSFSGDGQRFTAVVVQKASPTPNKFPRRAGLPNKRPLA